MSLELSLSNIRNPDWYDKERKIGKHSRKLNGETFVSPRIILPSDFKECIGKTYRLYEADAEVEEEFWGRTKKMKGKAIILLIPESEEVEESDSEIDDDWDDLDE
jgi:hypothetical protein